MPRSRAGALPSKAVLASSLPLLLLTAALSGCTAVDDLGGVLGGERRPVEVVLLNEEFVFHANEPPALPETVHSEVYTFAVPPRASELRVVMTVSFNLPVPPPQGVPQGRVVVAVQPPTGNASTFEFSEPGGDLYTADPPAQGPYDVRVEALGEGTVRLVATALQAPP